MRIPVRYFSASSLGRQADAAALPLLETLARGDRLQHVRIAAVDAIGASAASAASRRARQSLRRMQTTRRCASSPPRALGAVNDESALAPLSRR